MTGVEWCKYLDEIGAVYEHRVIPGVLEQVYVYVKELKEKYPDIYKTGPHLRLSGFDDHPGMVFVTCGGLCDYRGNGFVKRLISDYI